MPRKRPSQLRPRSRKSSTRRPGLPHATSALAAAVRLVENERYWPGAVADALRRWKQPPDEVGCPYPTCGNFYQQDALDVLQVALHMLPRRPARELRKLTDFTGHRTAGGRPSLRNPTTS